MTWDAAIIPSTPMLLPSYARAIDPIADLRAAALAAVAWLANRAPEQIVLLGAPADPANVRRGVSEPLSRRVARSLLAEVGFTGLVHEDTADLSGGGVLVVADGSARRGEKAPGHVDQRAFAFDDVIENAIRTCDASALRDLSEELGSELLAAGVPALKALGGLAGAAGHTAEMVYADDPFGVMYWVARWQRAGADPQATSGSSPRD